MGLHLYLVTSDKCPGPYGNAECILVMEEEVDPATISVDSLRFMTTVLFNNPAPAGLRERFEKWWGENGGGRAQLELLADDRARIAPGRLASAHEVREDGWTVRASFVAYPAESAELHAEARNIVLEADLLQH